MISQPNEAERRDIGLILTLQYFFIMLELPIRPYHLSIQQDSPKDNGQGND